MPHFDKVPFPSSHQIPKSVRSLEAYYSTLSKHIRSYCIFGVSSPAQAHLLNFTFRGSIIKSFFFSFYKNKTSLFFFKVLFSNHTMCYPRDSAMALPQGACFLIENYQLYPIFSWLRLCTFSFHKSSLWQELSLMNSHNI